MQPLQDATDISVATDKEIAHLAEWKLYRVRLSRIDTSKTSDIEWPVKPN
ncbi:tail fiber assembly protein [Pantoea vagans]